jgi:hypothetical protein
LAYVSNETGRAEVYVSPLSGLAKVPVSVDGGTEPVWARNGAELFYRDKNKMMVVDVTTEPSFRPDKPRMLFEKVSMTSYWSDIVTQYDISPDGQRFLMVEPAERVDVTEITLVQNWFEELKRLVPTY